MTLAQSLQTHGLYLRGVARLTAQESENYALDVAVRDVALVGNIGSSYWEDFSQAEEFADGGAHPLDRWSRRIATQIADAYPVTPIFPFDGPPYYPFQQWAQRAEGLHQSPLGIMIHPQYGLWHSYRFALLGRDFAAGDSFPDSAAPCLTCVDQPCLRRCPVDAFSAEGYAAERCANYLLETPEAECLTRGCLARYACPVAPELRYLPAQGEFHLRAFLQARR